MELTKDERRVLTRILTVNGFREIAAVVPYGGAGRFAPNDRARKMCETITRQEQGHYEAVLAVGRTYGIDVAPLVAQRMKTPPQAFPSVNSWADFILNLTFADAAGYFVMESLAGSKVPEYAEFARQALRDEAFHHTSGTSNLIGVLNSLPAEERLPKLMTNLACGVHCIGRPDTVTDRDAVRMGLKGIPAKQTLASFCDYVDKTIRPLDFHDLTPFANNVDRVLASPYANY